MDDIAALTKSLTRIATTEINRLQDKIENMKCCGNCGVNDCIRSCTAYCEDWKDDNQTQKDRDNT